MGFFRREIEFKNFQHYWLTGAMNSLKAGGISIIENESGTENC